jgi:hypothetical protein
MLDNDYDYDNDNDNEPPRDFCTAPLVNIRVYPFLEESTSQRLAEALIQGGTPTSP